MGDEKTVEQMTLTFNVKGKEEYSVVMTWKDVRLPVVFLVEKLLAEAQAKFVPVRDALS